MSCRGAGDRRLRVNLLAVVWVARGSWPDNCGQNRPDSTCQLTANLVDYAGRAEVVLPTEPPDLFRSKEGEKSHG